MPPKLKKKYVKCNGCSRGKQCLQVVQPMIGCEEGERPDVLVLDSQPSHDDDVGGFHFSSPYNIKYVRGSVKSLGLSYVYDSAVRCHSKGQPTTAALATCKSKWVAEVKKWNPKAVMACGKYAAEAILGRKAKITKIIGQSIMADYDGLKIPTVFGYGGDYVGRYEGKKGGEGEKAISAFFDAWDTLEEVVKNGIAERPKIRQLRTYREVISFLDFLLYKYDGKIAYDYEAWGDKNTVRPELCKEYMVLSIGVGYDDKGIAFPLDYPGHFDEDQIYAISKRWIKVLEKESVKIAHNAKFEHKCNFKRFGYTSYLEDTMLIMNVISELAPSSLGMVGNHFGFSWSGYKVESSDIQQAPKDTPLDELLDYNGLDAILTYRIHSKSLLGWDVEVKKKNEEPRIEKEYVNAEVLEMKQRYAMHLAEVEMNGMYTDAMEVPKIRGKLKKRQAEIEVELHGDPTVKKVERWCRAPKKEKGKLVLDKRGKSVQNIKSFKKDSKFNHKSPIQMKRLCKDVLKLGIKPKVKWKNGEKTESYSFDKRALEPYEESHPIVKTLNEGRSIDAMFAGFLLKWEDFTGPDGCVHTNYNQDVVLTGRLSSTEPNLQNIPGNSEIKKAFASRFGNKLGRILSSDYKQIEPRILAGWSEDPELCEALNGGFDLHKFVASRIYDVEYDDVTYEQRQLGKRMNLGQMYGQTKEGLAVAANISIEHAGELQALYFRKFHGIKDFRKEYHDKVRLTGLSKDLFGGTRHLPNGRDDKNRMLRERAERQASNYPIQSTANHFCLIGLCEVMDLLKERDLPALVVGTVHDSLILDYKISHEKEVIKAVTDGMLIHNTADYWKDKPVPMAIDISIGQNYKELAEVA